MSAGASGRESTEASWLPDFCSLNALAAVVLLAEVLILVVLLAPGAQPMPSFELIVASSLYVEWLALCIALTLCKLRPTLLALPTALGVAVAYALILAITATGSALIYSLDQALGTRLTLPPGAALRFVAGNVILAALVGAAAFRYFYVQAQWQRQIRAEARAKVAALQARIRPHFLFNSMNTIASLIRTRPLDAERAIEDLSDLFRAALRSGDGPSTLGTELELVRRYLDIEQLRLGERLRVSWAVDTLPIDLASPSLLLQPLVENAVHHGIQPLPEGGTVEIAGHATATAVEVAIRNPCPPSGARKGGNRIALDNIRQRLALHYGDRAALEAQQGADYYACRLSLPRP
jgi:two-component system sensor histidine kinase AlgZ